MSKVAAVTLRVRRLEEASAFYELLGFREHHRQEDLIVLHPRTYLGAELILTALEGESTPLSQDADGVNLNARGVEQGGVQATPRDVPALVLEGVWDRGQLETKGLTFLEKEFNGFPQGLCVRDPDGNLVLLRNTPDYDSYSI